MSAIRLDELLEQHQEDYDRDCHVHEGCSCDWEPSADQSEGDIEECRREYRTHLESVILARVQVLPAEARWDNGWPSRPETDSHVVWIGPASADYPSESRDGDRLDLLGSW